MAKRIVLVEDDEAIRDAFLMAFINSGYEFIELTNGEKITSNQLDAPDLFILDKNISGSDGLEVCQYVKSSERYKHVPVIIFSANPDIVNIATAAGADGVISKPFSLKKLRETLSHILES